MKRETRDKFASGTKQSDLTTGNACWETPPAVFAKLSEDFGPFDVDLTADARRHLCPVWFGPDSPVECFDAITRPVDGARPVWLLQPALRAVRAGDVARGEALVWRGL